jgi:hypothetical protein
MVGVLTRAISLLMLTESIHVLCKVFGIQKQASLMVSLESRDQWNGEQWGTAGGLHSEDPKKLLRM